MKLLRRTERHQDNTKQQTKFNRTLGDEEWKSKHTPIQLGLNSAFWLCLYSPGENDLDWIACRAKKKTKHAHRQTCTAQDSLHDFQQHECCSQSAFQVLEAGKFWMKSQDSSPNILPALSSSVFFFLHKGFGSIMYLWPSYIGFININTKWCNFTLGKGSSIYQRVILMCLRFYFIDSCISLTHVNSNQLCAHCERHAYL